MDGQDQQTTQAPVSQTPPPSGGRMGLFNAQGQAQDKATQGPQQGGGVDVQALLQNILKGQQTKHIAPPQINPKFDKASPMGMIPYIGGALQNSVKAKKQAEVNKFAYLWRSLDDAYTLAQQMSNGDPKKAQQLFQASDAFTTIFNAHDPKAFKTLKEMSKVFQAPWLEDGGGDSPAIHGLKKHMQTKSAEDQAKYVQQMSQQFMSKLQQQPAPTIDPKAGGEIASKATEQQRTDIERQKENRLAQDKWDIKPMTNAKGENVWGYFDKTHPDRGAQEFKISGTNQGVKTQPKGAMPQLGKSQLVNGVPTGVWVLGKEGRLVLARPGDPDWTPEAQKAYNNDMATWKVGEISKQNRLNSYAWTRAQAFATFNPKDVLDTDSGNVTVASAYDMAMHPDQYVFANEAAKVTLQLRTYDEIDSAFKALDTSITKLPKALSATQQAELAIAMRSDDPKSAMSRWFTSEVGKNSLDKDQQDYVVRQMSAVESAMMLRASGNNRSSQDIRDAIVNMTPGVVPNKAYAQQQMKALWLQLNTLRKGTPGLGKLGTGGVAAAPGRNPNGGNWQVK